MATLPIVAAYEAVAALDICCPSCHAPVGVLCTRDDGRVRRAPCVARCRSGGPVVGSTDPELPRRAVEARSAPRPGGQIQLLDYPDPSEPRHPRDNQ